MSQFSYSNLNENQITTNNYYQTNQINPIIIENNNHNYNYNSYSYEMSSNNYKTGTNNLENIINNNEIINENYQINDQNFLTNNEINHNIYGINENNIQMDTNNYQTNNINKYQVFSFNPSINEQISYPSQTFEIQDIKNDIQNVEQNYDINNINNIEQNQIITTNENNIILNENEYNQILENNSQYLINNTIQNDANTNEINTNIIKEESNENNIEEIKEEKKLPFIDNNTDYTIEQYSEIFKKIIGNKDIENKEFEDIIIKIIEKTDYVQRQQIREHFYRTYNDNLILKLKKELNGNFKESVLGSFLYPSEYDTYSINSAFKNNNQKKELILSEIIGSRSITELQTIKKLYSSNYRKLLRKDIISETSGDFQKFLLSLLQCQRSTSSNPNTNSCANDASDLYRAGEKKRQNDEDTFIRIFTKSSPVEISIINHFYKQQTGKGLLGAIKTEFEFGKETKGLLDIIIRALIDKHGFYAKAIKDALSEGNDAKLIRIICSRYTVDLNEIKNAYKRDYEKELIEDIKDKIEENWGKVIYTLLDKA